MILNKNNKHSETDVPFKEKTVIIDGKEIKGVFPEFDSKFTTTLPDDLLKAKDTDQFKHCTEQLKKQIEKDPSQAAKYTEKQLEDIMNGEARPDGLTWHHNEQKGVMELVDRPIHADTGHTGGNSIWGDDIR